MPARTRAAAVLLVVGCLVVAACGIEAKNVAAPTTTTTTAPPITTPPTAPPTTQPKPMDEAGLRSVIGDVQAFWAKELPAVYGTAYEAVPAAKIIAGVPDGSYPVCDGHQLEYKDVEGNAFAADCPEGITVVWDAADLIPSIEKKHGSIAAAVVLAHEWGHVAQDEAGIKAQTVILEQQADCFAGAWLNHFLADPGSLAPVAAGNPLDSALAAIITFRDAPGSSPTDPGAHGTGFDRVRALQEGYDRGPTFCKTYVSKPPPLVVLDLPLENGEVGSGNLPLNELITDVTDDLNTFYGKLITDFQGASAQSIMNDPSAMATLKSLSDRIGDNAAGVVLGMIWAGFAQNQTGADKGRNAEGILLQQACLSGGWLADVYNDTNDKRIKLTAGDLDEAILGLIDLSDGDSTKNTNGAAFKVVAALRQGVISGFSSCGLK